MQADHFILEQQITLENGISVLIIKNREFKKSELGILGMTTLLDN